MTTFVHNQHEKNPHLHKVIVTNKNYHLLPEGQNLTIVYVTLIGVPITLRGQDEEQIDK